MLDRLMEKGIVKLSSCSPTVIIILISIIVVATSIPIVYLLVMLFGAEYTTLVFIMSIAAPALMVPPTIAIMIKLSKHLVHFKEALEDEVQKNKEGDLILFEQARFALMGEMMANISHQWKQPLNTISLSVVNLKTSDKTEDEMDKHFDIMEDNVNYLATTIDDFMSFFDKRTHLETRDLNSIVKEIKSIIGAHISNKNIELQITIDDSYGGIEISSSISQVVLNFLSNAKDSLEGEDKRKMITLQFTSNEYGLEIECCDNGKGIDEKIKDKIFDPYFSTKEKQQGTGIGLYMSKAIIQKIFHGQINLSSRKQSRSSRHPVDNSGRTCFYIAIPYSKNCLLIEDYK